MSLAVSWDERTLLWTTTDGRFMTAPASAVGDAKSLGPAGGNWDVVGQTRSGLGLSETPPKMVSIVSPAHERAADGRMVRDLWPGLQDATCCALADDDGLLVGRACGEVVLGGPGDAAPRRVIARLRWKIELDYKQLKGELGLDHYEGRSWLGWYHHTALVTAANGFLTLERLNPFHPRPA